MKLLILILFLFYNSQTLGNVLMDDNCLELASEVLSEIDPHGIHHSNLAREQEGLEQVLDRRAQQDTPTSRTEAGSDSPIQLEEAEPTRSGQKTQQETASNAETDATQNSKREGKVDEETSAKPEVEDSAAKAEAEEAAAKAKAEAEEAAAKAKAEEARLNAEKAKRVSDNLDLAKGFLLERCQKRSMIKICERIFESLDLTKNEDDFVDILETIESTLFPKDGSFPEFKDYIKLLKELDGNGLEKLKDSFNLLKKGLTEISDDILKVDESLFDIESIILKDNSICHNWHCYDVLEKNMNKMKALQDGATLQKGDLISFAEDLTAASYRHQEYSKFGMKRYNTITELRANLPEYHEIPGLELFQQNKFLNTRERLDHLEVLREKLFETYFEKAKDSQLAQMHQFNFDGKALDKAKSLYRKGKLFSSTDKEIQEMVKQVSDLFEKQTSQIAKDLSSPNKITRLNAERFIDNMHQYHKSSIHNFDKLSSKAAKRLCPGSSSPEDCYKNFQKLEEVKVREVEHKELYSLDSSIREHGRYGVKSDPPSGSRKNSKCGTLIKLSQLAVKQLGLISIRGAAYACIDQMHGLYEICSERGNWLREVSFTLMDVTKRTADGDAHWCFR